MQYPELTARYGALLALIYVALSIWVIAGRWQYRVSLGAAGNSKFERRVRSHANFIEYVPLILILVGLLEMAHASRFAIHVLLLPLLVARLMHPIGLMAQDLTPQQGAFRGGGTVITLLVLGIAAIMLLVRMA